MTTWFTSDQHFGHANIIKYANRPFANVDEMDEQMISRWNSRVRYHDTVYHLGDFTLGDDAAKYFSRLTGNVRILGNNWHHDRRWLEKAIPIARAEILPALIVLEIPKPPDIYPHVIMLCHYPIAEWDRKHYGAIHLHGHSHGKFLYPPGTKALDVGVDVHGFAPISLEEVLEIMEAK